MGRAIFATTSDLDPAARIDFWNKGSSRIGGVHAMQLSDVFDAHITFRQLDTLSIYRLSSTPHRVEAKALGYDQGRMLRLRYQRTGNSRIVQGNRSLEVGAGDWLIIDPHLPHAAINRGCAEHLWLTLPCDRLTAAEVETATALANKLPMSSRTSGMLREVLCHAIDVPGSVSRSNAQELSNQITRVFRQALQEVPHGVSEPSVRAETARRARAYIVEHLHDPELSVDRIANALGCTPRYVHKVFEGSESVSRYIWNQRLEVCRRNLERQGGQPQTLTSLAFDYGFNSSSHFSRSFRERFGTSPSAYQADMRRRQA